MDERVISVCMPYYRRQEALERSLAAYARLYGDIEISICDDGSPEPVKAPGHVVTRLQQKDYPLNPCVPANAAVRASSGDLIVLTNPEIEHREDVLSAMLGMLESDSDYVAAKCFDVTLDKLIVGPGAIRERERVLRLPDGAYFHMCAMMHKSLFERVGGFDEDYRDGFGYEDNDFLWRLSEAGACFKLCEDATVYHYRVPRGDIPPTNEQLFLSRWSHKWE